MSRLTNAAINLPVRPVQVLPFTYCIQYLYMQTITYGVYLYAN